MREATLNRAKPGSIFGVSTRSSLVHYMEKFNRERQQTSSLSPLLTMIPISNCPDSLKWILCTKSLQFTHWCKFQNIFSNLQYLRLQLMRTQRVRVSKVDRVIGRAHLQAQCAKCALPLFWRF